MNISEKSNEQRSVLERLNKWAEEPVNNSMMGAHASSVTKKIRSSIFLASTVQSAAEYKPTVGVYGPSQAGKSYLTAKFAENEQGLLKVKLGSEFDFLQEINPPGGRESTALVSRFTSDLLQDDDAFPIQAHTLSEIDVICILSNSYFCDNSHAEYPSVTEIERVLKDYNFDNNKFDLSLDSEAYRLEHYLVGKVFPNEVSEKFKALWGKAVVIKQLKSLHERAELYSLLWNRDEKFTALFIKLSETLQRLGNTRTIYLPISSLIPRSTSIIDVSILEHLDTESSQVEVVKTDDGEVSIEKPVLSALISELYLPIVNPRQKVFEKADLLDFPGARTRFKRSFESSVENGIHEFYLRGKIDYLFHKFTMDLRLDALVFCIDPGPLNVRELPDSLDDWLQLNCHDQLTTGTNLFFTLTKFDTHFPDAAGNQTNVEQRFENAMDSGLIQPFAREANSWPLNWNGHTFDNVFPVRNPNYPLHGYFEYEDGIEVSKSNRMEKRLKELREGFLSSNLVSAHVKNSQEKWDDLVRVNGGGTGYLANQIDELDLEKLKERNLNGTLDTLAKSICETLAIFIKTEDGEERLQLEKKKLKELLQPIYAIGKSEKFSVFLRSVGVNEQLLTTALRSWLISDTKQATIKPETVDLDGWQPDLLLADEGSDVEIEVKSERDRNGVDSLADRVLSTWLQYLSGSTSAAKISRDLNTSAEAYEFLVSHLAHSTQIEKLRVRIASRLEILTYGPALDSILPAAARIASDEINSHLHLRPSDISEDTVKNSNISKFEILELESPISKWQKWINSFGEILTENCSVRADADFDTTQNSILVENVQQLTEV